MNSGEEANFFAIRLQVGFLRHLWTSSALSLVPSLHKAYFAPSQPQNVHSQPSRHRADNLFYIDA
jgi:hypothetical protein